MQISPIHYRNNINNSISFRSYNSHEQVLHAEERIAKYGKKNNFYPSIYLFYEKSDKTPEEYGGLQKGQFLDSKGYVYNKNFTTYSRSDLDWIDLGSYLKEKFDSPEKVNFSVFGCSSGEEAYSLAVLLKHCYPDSDFEINAYDIDRSLIEKNIKNQQKGVVVSMADYNKMSRDLGIKPLEMRQYFSKSVCGNTVFDKEITDRVKFKTANILTEIDRMDLSKPTVMFCRNMWPYIDSAEYDDFAKNLYDRLAPGSLVVIGGFDHFGDSTVYGSNLFPSALVDNNFKIMHRGLGQGVSFLKNEQFVVYEK